MQLLEMNLWQVMIFRLYILYNKHKMIKIGTQNREISQVLSQVLEYFFGGVYIRKVIQKFLRVKTKIPKIFLQFFCNFFYCLKKFRLFFKKISLRNFLKKTLQYLSTKFRRCKPFRLSVKMMKDRFTHKISSLLKQIMPK